MNSVTSIYLLYIYVHTDILNSINDDFDRDSLSIKNEELKSDLMRGVDPLLLKKMDIVRGYIDPFILDELLVTTDGEYDLAPERRLDIEKQQEDILDCTFMLKASSIELMQPLQYCIFTTLLDEMLLNFVQKPSSLNNYCLDIPYNILSQ